MKAIVQYSLIALTVAFLGASVMAIWGIIEPASALFMRIVLTFTVIGSALGVTLILMQEEQEMGKSMKNDNNKK